MRGTFEKHCLPLYKMYSVLSILESIEEAPNNQRNTKQTILFTISIAKQSQTGQDKWKKHIFALVCFLL